MHEHKSSLKPNYPTENKEQLLYHIARDITDPKAAEDKYRNIFDNAIEGIFQSSSEGRYITVNPAMARIYGYDSPQELLENISDISKQIYVDSQDRATLNRRLEKEDIVNNFESQVYRNDGTVIWISENVRAVRDEEGKILYYEGFVTDISDAKNREAERKQAEAKQHQLKLALENAVEGIALLDSQGCYLQVNQAYANITGYPPEEMIGMDWQVTVHPEDLEQLLIAYRQMLEEGKVEVEARGKRKDGSLFFKQVVMITAFNENQEFIGHYCFLKDITHRKQKEERLRLLESVVVNTNDVILITEAEPIDEPGPLIVYVNEAFTNMTGYTLEELWLKTPRILQGEKTQRSELDKIRYALENWQSVRVELINYRKDGSEFWVEINITPVADEGGWYTHWVSIQREITERKLAEEQLKAQTLRSQLFADISLKIRQSLQLEDILKTTVTELQKLLDADRVLILRLEAPRTLCVIQETIKPGWDSVIDQVFLDDCLDEEYFVQYPQGRLYSISNVDKLEDHQCLIEFLRQAQVKSRLVIPLLLQERLWGMIVIHQCSYPRNWSSWEIDLLKQIADQIAIALAQSYLVKALDNFSTNLKHLHRINTTNYANFDDLFNDCLATGCSIFGMSTGIISQIAGESYKIQAVRSPFEFLEIGLEFSVKDTYCAAVIQEKSSITYTRVRDIESMQTHPVYQNLQLESYIGTPILVDGRIHGTLNFSSIQPRANNFESQELEAIELMAQSIGKFIAAHQTEIQRQQAELALRESEGRFRTMADSAPVLLWISDTDKQCTFFNQSWLKFTGRSLEQELGHNRL